MDRSKEMLNHNNPPNDLDEALSPYGDAIELAEGMLSGDPVENEVQMKAVDAVLKDIKAAEKAVKMSEESAAKPVYDAWKAEKARFTPTLEDLARIKKGLTAMVGDFKKALAAKKEAERRAAFAEADRLRKEAEAKARNDSDIDAQREAAAMALAAKQAQQAARQTEKVKGNDKPAVTAFIEDYAQRFRQINTPMDGLRVWEDREAF